MAHDGGEEHNLEYRKARIRQANALAKSGQELDLNEKRLLIAMSRIKSSDTELLTHRIGMKELVTHLGENPYARAERAARGLLRRLVYVPTENGGFKEFQWTTVAEYVPAESSETGESHVKIRLNEELAPLLLELLKEHLPDALVITHAHSDHIGALAVLKRMFPDLPVYMTGATARITLPMLIDAARVAQRNGSPMFTRRT